jgi:hypothetical protein
MSQSLFVFIKKHRPVTRFVIVFTAMSLAFSSLLPVFVGNANAVGQLTSRSLAISSAVPSGTGVKYTYTFTQPTVGTIQSIKFVACTTATSTYAGSAACTGGAVPGGMTIQAGSQVGSLSGNWQSTTAFSRDAVGSNGCVTGGNANILCIKRTAAAPNETATSKSITWDTQTNPSTANSAFYVGIFLYSDAAWNTPTDSGTVASAVVQTLTVDARVAEYLAFCVGSTGIDDATTSVAGDCTGVSGSAVNLGTLDSSTINISPVTTNGGDSNNGVAMIRSNAANGSTVSYDAIQATTGTNHLGTLRISGASCSAGSSNSDGCINAASTTQNTFTAGTEEFGMTIAGVNCGSTSASSYTCTYPSSNNIVPQTNYLGKTGAYCTACNTSDGGNGYAWDDTGAATVIASSASSSIKQIDDEALVLKFAATSNIISPFGAYSVQADFIASPTF